jgi:hypothetical protein
MSSASEDRLLFLVENWKHLGHDARAVVFHLAWRGVSKRKIFYSVFFYNG